MNDSHVLPSFYADIVTQPIMLPPDPDKSKIYVTKAYSSNGKSKFVSVIFHSSTTMDLLMDSDEGTHMMLIFDRQNGKTSVVCGGGNVALAAGLYLKLGFGFLPGKGRNTIQFENKDGTTLSSSNEP